MTVSKEFLNIPPLGKGGGGGGLGASSKVPCFMFAMLTFKTKVLRSRIKLSVNNMDCELGPTTLMFMFCCENFPSGL